MTTRSYAVGAVLFPRDPSEGVRGQGDRDLMPRSAY